MKLKGVEISGFRSIQDAALEQCGEFNVLIGKNNAGKSNILSAIALFFAGVRGGQVVSDGANSLDTLDFHGKIVENPYHFTMTFSLTLAERDVLIRDIVSEAPQLKNVVDGISPSLDLVVIWTVVPGPSRFGYVSRIAISPTIPEVGGEEQDRVLLAVNSAAATELFERTSRARRLSDDLASLDQLLDRLDSFWRRYSREAKSERVLLRYLLEDALRPERSVQSRSGDLVRSVERIFDESTSQEEVTSALNDYKQRLDAEAELLRNEQIASTISTFAGEETIVPQYVRSLLGRIEAIKVLHLRERRTTIGVTEAQKLLELKVRRGGEQRLNSIRETVSTLLGVAIDAYAGDSTTLNAQSPAELDVDDFLVQANGAGIKEALRIVLDYEFEQPQILLVEEPEIHLHPALEIAMMRYLRTISSDCQVFITTHSTNFLDTAEMKNVYLITREDSTKIQRIDLQSAQDSIPRELGMRLSAFFMFDRLVFVEGPTDESVLREFASTLRTNLGQANVGFVPMGGSRKFAYYATETSLTFLSKRRIRVWFLLDRDEGNDETLREFFERVGSNATVKVLKKRELENYLLHPRAVSEFIRLKRELLGGVYKVETPSTEEVEDVLKNQADELQSLVIAKLVSSTLCTPIYPAIKGILEKHADSDLKVPIVDELKTRRDEIDHRISEVSNVYRHVEELVKTSWESERLDIVQGDELLDRVCSQYGVRFKKDVDAARIASVMTEAEIPIEIREFLQDVGS